MQDLFKYAMDGLVYSSQAYTTPNTAALAAYLGGNINESELEEGVSVYIGKVTPINLNINMDTILEDIQNGLSEFVPSGLNITYGDKAHLKEYLTKFIMDRNPYLYETTYIGSILVNRQFVKLCQNTKIT